MLKDDPDLSLILWMTFYTAVACTALTGGVLIGQEFMLKQPEAVSVKTETPPRQPFIGMI